MDELWSGDRAVLTRVVELYEETGEEFEPEQLLEAFPTSSMTLYGTLCADWARTATSKS